MGRLMRHRATTGLEAYYKRADELMIVLSFWTLAALVMASVVTFVLRQPVGALLVFCSLMVTSLLFFAVFELFPSAIVRFGLDRIDYFGWKSCCVPDPTMIFRYRPLMDELIPFRGYLFSPVYRVEVPVMRVHLTTDKDGFIHNNAAPEVPDIAVIGDSFIGDACR